MTNFLHCKGDIWISIIFQFSTYASILKRLKELEFWGHKLKHSLFLSIQVYVTMPLCLKKILVLYIELIMIKVYMRSKFCFHNIIYSIVIANII